MTTQLEAWKTFKGVRPEVQRFAALMEETLRKNDYKGGWTDCTPAYLLGGLMKEVLELLGEMTDGTDPAIVILKGQLSYAQWCITSPRLINVSFPKVGKYRNPIFETADVSNFCMMIAEGMLRKEANE